MSQFHLEHDVLCDTPSHVLHKPAIVERVAIGVVCAEG